MPVATRCHAEDGSAARLWTVAAARRRLDAPVAAPLEPLLGSVLGWCRGRAEPAVRWVLPARCGYVGPRWPPALLELVAGHGEQLWVVAVGAV